MNGPNPLLYIYIYTWSIQQDILSYLFCQLGQTRWKTLLTLNVFLLIPFHDKTVESRRYQNYPLEWQPTFSNSVTIERNNTTDSKDFNNMYGIWKPNRLVEFNFYLILLTTEKKSLYFRTPSSLSTWFIFSLNCMCFCVYKI